MPPRLRVLLSVLALLAVLWPARAWASPGFSETCEQALPKQQLDDLLDRMARAGA